MTDRQGARRRTFHRVAALVVGLLLALSGCVSIPTSGPVERVEGEQPACDTCVNLEVEPPAPNDDPQTIVQGFLRANTSYQPGYTIARQFLTRDAAAQWSPDQGATVYDGPSLVGNGDTVTLTGTQVAYLGTDRTYTAQLLPLKVGFELERELGEWRISKLPAGLTIQQSSFDTFYKPYDLFFIGDGKNLVPQSIYLPNLRNPDSFASALVNALLEGPSTWLAPAVTTAVPARTTLSVDSVTIVNGVAQVPLSADVQQLGDPDRSLLAAQLVYTLQQVTGVKKVLLLSGNQPFQVPESESGDLAVPVGGIPAALDPVPQVGSEELYVVRRDGLGRITEDGDSADVVPVTGELATKKLRIDSVAVSAVGDQLALVTDDRTALRRGSTGSGRATTLLTGVSRLLRPQFGRNGELWAIGEQGGRQQIWLFTANGPREVLAPSVLAAGRITGFAVSPDGARISLLVRSGSTTAVGLARIVRADQVRVDAWRPLDLRASSTSSTSSSEPKAIRDLAWTDATNLVMLSAPSAKGPFVPTELSDDASQITSEPQVFTGDPVQVAVLLRTKTAVVAAGDGKVYRDDGATWQYLVDGVETMASPS